MSDAPVLGPVNMVDDLDAATDFERKHTPFVKTEPVDGGVRVTVHVGHYVAHPNDPDHFIAWVELYAGDAPIARFDLAPVASVPEISVVVNVDAGTELTAVEHCNLHGLWGAKVTL
jgi:superoxide reductase